MALSYKKDLDKYKDIDEDEILNKLSVDELKQLETALEEMDPEVRTTGLEECHAPSKGGGVPVENGSIDKMSGVQK